MKLWHVDSEVVLTCLAMHWLRVGIFAMEALTLRKHVLQVGATGGVGVDILEV